MRAYHFLAMLLFAPATAAWSEEPTFIDSKGHVIGAPSDAKPEHAHSSRLRVRESRGQDCIKTRSIKAESAESETSLIFHTNDGRAYRTLLATPCDGLIGVNNAAQLRLGGKDGRLCAGDDVWLGSQGLLAGITGGGNDAPAPCKLGKFEGISEMSLTELLRR